LTATALIDGPQDAPVLLFLHGVGSDARVWAPQLLHFRPRYRCVAWTMPGFGDSPRLPAPTGEGMTWDGMTEAVLELLDVLEIEKAAIIGHSLGGMIAQHFGARHVDRLSALVLSGASPSFGDPNGEWQKEWVRARVEPLESGQKLVDLGPKMIRGMMGPNEPDAGGLTLALEALSVVTEKAFVDAIRLTATFEGRAGLESLGAVPTLCLAGEHDGNAPAKMMARMAEKIPGARYVCLEGRGHLANLENPAAYNAALEAFFAQAGIAP
jgi:3-oxoadipate enol-lactonase